MKAELIQYIGSDIITVNAARVSFDKESEWEYDLENEGYPGVKLGEKDIKLINYLAKHNHFTPFTHSTITMRETVPIFVARQRFKHVVGFSYNEVSRRYVDAPPEFFYPNEWRGKPINAKQGSSEEVIDIQPSHDGLNLYKYHMDLMSNFYDYLVNEKGVAPEQARMVLPQSMYTSYYTTGSLAAWARAYNLRSDPHSQKEIQDLAAQWHNIISGIPELKYSWAALTNKEV